jgi:TctA family transporter
VSIRVGLHHAAISLVLLIAAALALLFAVLPSIRRKREVVFQEEE